MRALKALVATIAVLTAAILMAALNRWLELVFGPVVYGVGVGGLLFAGVFAYAWKAFK